MPDYNVGDKVVLKDDGQIYKIIGVRIEDHVVLYDLQKGDQNRSLKLTVMRSQIETQKVCTPKFPQYIVYKSK